MYVFQEKNSLKWSGVSDPSFDMIASELYKHPQFILEHQTETKRQKNIVKERNMSEAAYQGLFFSISDRLKVWFYKTLIEDYNM
ncbi:hypothetical protein AB1K32_16460 [Metabacillus dongyingensis]|uniref:hypothetical protein n=1 Tax=Metabacillus dongyingensis TaxID=2874282 RepID=UPI003B8D7618